MLFSASHTERYHAIHYDLYIINLLSLMNVISLQDFESDASLWMILRSKTSRAKKSAAFGFILPNINDNVHNSRNTGYPMKFSRLLFHRIQSYGISVGYYWGMEMWQAIGSCYLNGLERSVRLTCPIYVPRSPFDLTGIHSFILWL